MKLIIFFIIFTAFVCGNIFASEDGSRKIEELTSTVSFDDNELQREASQMGVPSSETKRYVVEMRALNYQYQQGSLTRTEYVAAKQNLIERLK